MTLGRTPSQTVGPYFVLGLCREPANELVAPTTPGAIRIVGRVFDGTGEGVSDAMLELFQPEGWARCGTDAGGAYHFVTVKPKVGKGAPHVEMLVFARGLLKHLVTRIYFSDEPGANAADPVLSAVEPARRATLIAQHEDGALRFDVHLQGDAETVFFAV